MPLFQLKQSNYRLYRLPNVLLCGTVKKWRLSSQKTPIIRNMAVVNGPAAVFTAPHFPPYLKPLWRILPCEALTLPGTSNLYLV